MSKHRKALPQIVHNLSKRHPGCGVLVSGSVQRGEERPDSDFDLFVVYKGRGDLGLDEETRIGGFRMNFAWFPEETLHAQLASDWYEFWMFSRAEIVHDPTGIAKRSQELVLACFRDNPEIDRAWEQQLLEVRRHKSDRSYQLKHWTWDEFARHVEKLVKGGKPS